MEWQNDIDSFFPGRDGQNTVEDVKGCGEGETERYHV